VPPQMTFLHDAPATPIGVPRIYNRGGHVVAAGPRVRETEVPQ